MSRLWMTTQSDLRKGTGKGASESATVQIFWGSAGDSKLAGEVNVWWPKDNLLPEVTFEVGSTIKIYKKPVMSEGLC